MEHPVTEWISHVNIPSCQLLIGMGVPLHRIPDIRRVFGKDPMGIGAIDFDNEPQIPPSGASLCHLLGAISLAASPLSPVLRMGKQYVFQRRHVTAVRENRTQAMADAKAGLNLRVDRMSLPAVGDAHVSQEYLFAEIAQGMPPSTRRRCWC